MVSFGKRPKTLPVVLGRQRTFLTTLYATGMRFSEAANLRIADIDSKRMQIRITNGKGAKQRQVPLSPRLLDKTYADTTIQKAIKASALAANINKNVTPHKLRHSYATGLLEAGVDLHCRQEHLGSRQYTEPAGLAASQTTADLSTTASNRQAERRSDPA